jgi:hypothetical protein
MTGASAAPISNLVDAWTCKIWRRNDHQGHDTDNVHETRPAGSQVIKSGHMNMFIRWLGTPTRAFPFGKR